MKPSQVLARTSNVRRKMLEFPLAGDTAVRKGRCEAPFAFFLREGNSNTLWHNLRCSLLGFSSHASDEIDLHSEELIYNNSLDNRNT